MVGVSLRQKPASATDQNAHISLRPAARPAAVRPVSGTPVWARNDHAPGAPRPASPWDTWTIPPKPTALNRTRKPSPRPIGGASDPSGITGSAGTATAEPAAPVEPSPPFRPWRIDFTRPDVVEYPADTEQPDPPTVARRLLLLLGLAYLFLAALASGLAYTSYFATTDNSSTDDEPPGEGTLPPQPPSPQPPSPRPPSRDPHAPGLHTRPDGTRYLVMPLPADLADRFRGRADALHTAPAIGGGLL